MSTLRVSNINNASASSGGLSIDSSGVVTGGLPSPNRNLLYNGAMQVAQRGTSTTGITTSGYYTADRWNYVIGSLGTWTESVENDAPTGSGFRKSLKILCTTADSSPASSDVALVQQAIEGQDLQRIAKGTSDAQQVTLSFWVKSNVTGTYAVALRDNDNTRSVASTYLVNASATWEKKTITFPADTTGAFDNDNGGSLSLQMIIGAGTDYTSGTLQTTWGSNVDANLAVGQTNLASATNNYWQVTGVQLEVGPTATPFEFKSYGQELAECQRYCIAYGGNSTDYATLAFSIGYSDANSFSAIAVTDFSTMRNINAITVTTVGTQGTDWGVYTNAGIFQTGFTVSATGYGAFALTKTSHGIATGVALATRNSTGKIIVSSEL